MDFKVLFYFQHIAMHIVVKQKKGAGTNPTPFGYQ